MGPGWLRGCSHEWAAAAGCVDIVIGTWTAAWGRVRTSPGGSLIDEHDEALQSESSPTWRERRRRAISCRSSWSHRARRSRPCTRDPPCSLPCRVVCRGLADHVVHHLDEEPWKRSLLMLTLIGHLREPPPTRGLRDQHDRPARPRGVGGAAPSRWCERGTGRPQIDTDDLVLGEMVCGRCGATRPAVCLECGSSAFANLRPGVGLGHELTVRGCTAVTVTGADNAPPPAASRTSARSGPPSSAHGGRRGVPRLRSRRSWHRLTEPGVGRWRRSSGPPAWSAACAVGASWCRR